MKKNILFILLASTLTIFAGSCSTPYDATPSVDKGDIRNPFQGDFTAEIDGVVFTADIKSIYDTTMFESRFISLSGTQYTRDRDTTRNKTIQFSISNYEGPNIYYTNANSMGIYINVDSNITRNYMTFPGDTLSAITVTGDQDRLIGSFEMMVVNKDVGTPDTLFISKGKFDIPK